MAGILVLLYFQPWKSNQNNSIGAPTTVPTQNNLPTQNEQISEEITTPEPPPEPVTTKPITKKTPEPVVVCDEVAAEEYRRIAKSAQADNGALYDQRNSEIRKRFEDGEITEEEYNKSIGESSFIHSKTDFDIGTNLQQKLESVGCATSTSN